MRRRARRAALALAVVCGGLAAWTAAAGGQQAPPAAPATADAALAQRGRDLYAGTCAICHGEDLRGVRGQGPSLLRAGAAATDFYLSTGRMPIADPRHGNVARGKQTFTESCAGCHQVMARGGIVTGAFVPALQDATPRQIAEAVRVGPYLMPIFDQKRLSQSDVDDVAAYLAYTAKPDDRGGWGIGNIGPVPEGMITWLLAAVVLLGIARALGERAT